MDNGVSHCESDTCKDPFIHAPRRSSSRLGTHASSVVFWGYDDATQLGGVIIGLLGVLYDAAIGQAVSVEELTRIAPHVPRKTIYQRALRIGREHIGALVNTLAIAYVGASLPLLLLFYQTSSASIAQIANTEIFSTEIVRIMIGSIGLVLAVPITTLVSVLILVKKPTHVADSHTVSEESEALEHATHSHTH